MQSVKFHNKLLQMALERGYTSHSETAFSPHNIVLFLEKHHINTYEDLISVINDSSQSQELRLRAMTALSWFGPNKAAYEALQATLQDSDPTIRRFAVLYLPAVYADPLVDALRKAALEDPDQTVRMEALCSLGLINQPASISVLRSILRDETLPAFLRARAAEALGQRGNLDAVDDLVASLSSPIAAIRFWSAYALGEIGDSAVIPRLLALIDDPESVEGWWTVGEEARWAILAITNPEDARAFFDQLAKKSGRICG